MEVLVVEYGRLALVQMVAIFMCTIKIFFAQIC